MLITLPLATLAQARRCIQWETWCGLNERSHSVLTSGCYIELLPWKTAERLLWLTYQARVHPDLSWESVLLPQEWHTLDAAITKHRSVSATSPRLQLEVRWIAQQSGFLARTSDGEPDVQTIWRGVRRLGDLASLWVLLHPSSGCAMM